MSSFTVSTTALTTFRQRLLAWYRRAGRDLPWRHTHDPYKILVSEMMLQQTQVTTVITRYQRWLKRFPTIQVLAKATTAAVLQEWSGLGYNRRPLALHNIAKLVVEQHHGKFPSDITELQKFKGIGDYTAHAMASFAFKQRVPLVDTNIKRVLGRIFFGYRKLETIRDNVGIFWELSRQLIASAKSPYDVNQGLMDFGALICTAKQPKCPTCPMRTICQSYPDILTAHPDRLRVKAKRTEPVFFGQPRRIWRGKILQLLHQHTTGLTVTAIGKQLQPDWDDTRQAWLQAVIATLVKDKMLVINGNRVRIKV